MSDLSVLRLERREKTNSRISKKLRREGYLPGSISRKGKESLSVSVKTDELRKSISTHGRTALFKLDINGDTITGMVKDIQISPVKGSMIHVDFQEVSLDEEIRVDLDISLRGIDELEFKKLMALRQIDTITVRGLPQDMPKDITIDLSNIDKPENIFLKDIQFPEGITPEGDPEQLVISVVEVRRAASEEAEEGETSEETEGEN